MERKSWLKPIEKLGACKSAVDWAEQYGSLSEAWANCERGDWMLWLAGKIGWGKDDRKRWVLAACECARLSLPYVAEGETRPLKAIETAEAWANGANGVTLKMVRASAAAAYAAAHAAAYAAAYAADAAAHATAYAAAHAAAYAAHAAAHAADATAYAAGLKQCADIVRKWYPAPPTRR